MMKMESNKQNLKVAEENLLELKNILIKTNKREEVTKESSNKNKKETEELSKDPSKSPQKEENCKSRAPSPGRCSPKPKCAICLEDLQNKSFTGSCFHAFCFTCLVEWSKVKQKCPLCRQSFKSIVHNMRSYEEYDTYHVQVHKPLPTDESEEEYVEEDESDSETDAEWDESDYWETDSDWETDVEQEESDSENNVEEGEPDDEHDAEEGISDSEHDVEEYESDNERVVEEVDDNSRQQSSGCQVISPKNQGTKRKNDDSMMQEIFQIKKQFKDQNLQHQPVSSNLSMNAENMHSTHSSI